MRELFKRVTYLLKNPSVLYRRMFMFQSEINKARQAFGKANFSEAVEKLTRIINRQPDNFQAGLLLALVAVEMRDFPWAGAVIDNMIAFARRKKNLDYTIIMITVEILRRIGRENEAQSLILDLAPPEKHRESYLALAGCARHDLFEWQSMVNGFLGCFNLAPVRVSRGSERSGFILTAGNFADVEREPVVSVIMSAFNMAAHIRPAVRAILAQTWRNLELWVVDDHSTDRTVEIVREMAVSDSRIRLIRLPVNVGTYVCRNIAFERCAGDLVAIQDADDWCHPDRIRIQAEDMLSNPARAANFSRHVRMTEDGLFELRSNGMYTSRICLPSIMVRKESIIKRYGFWDSARVMADTEFWERLNIHSPGGSVRVIPSPLVFQLRRGGSLTTQPETMSYNDIKSPLRREYKESFRRWHATLGKESGKIPFPQKERVFISPEKNQVPFQDVMRALKNMRIE